MAYATGSTGLAITVRGSSRRIMIMRFRPANIRLINRRSKLLRLLLALSSGKENVNYQNNPTDLAQLTRSLHIRPKHSLTHKTVCSTTSHKRLSGLTFSAAQEPIVSLIERQRSNPFVATSGPGGTWNGSTEMRSYRTSSTVRVSVPLGA